jgi:hypothetical protein
MTNSDLQNSTPKPEEWASKIRELAEVLLCVLEQLKVNNSSQRGAQLT